MSQHPLLRRSTLHVHPDWTKVISLLFVAGEEPGNSGESRAVKVIERLMTLSEVEVRHRLTEVIRRFNTRHRDIVAVFRRHAERLESQIVIEAMSDERRLLVGASFTHEFSVESTSVSNPSIVAHPDQSTCPPGSVRFIMSVRAIGEGHLSSIGFRTGVIDERGTIALDDRGPFPEVGTVSESLLNRAAFFSHLRAFGHDGESSDYVLDHLPPDFTARDLDQRLEVLWSERDTRGDASAISTQLRTIAASSYEVSFDSESDISEHVLWPAMATESRGMEDARFVEFTHLDGTRTYVATYTAYNGSQIAQQMVQTDDFMNFAMSPVVGVTTPSKGLALFPRQINGRFVALSRYDGETNAISFSDTMGDWGASIPFQLPERDWETIQLGNCGSPIETDAGWLVLTHGVGPMRTYSIGAVLLDLDDPTTMIGSLNRPLITATPQEQDGYVPNVVYTCGAMVHDDFLVIPYGVADTRINFATVRLSDLLDELTTLPLG